MRKESDLDTWRLLFRVAERGSLTLAASELGIELSSASRRLSALEKSLGCDLLLRSSRAVGLTLAGQEAYDRMNALLTEWESVIANIGNAAGTSAAPVRVSAAIGFGQEVLAPLVVEFQNLHPGITIELILVDRPCDPVRDNVDVVFRYGPIHDETLLARRMGTVDFVVCASPDYLAAHGHPRQPADLAQHTLLCYNGQRRPASTYLLNQNRREPIPPANTLRFNNVLAIREAALASGGIGLDLPLHSCVEALRHGQLVRVLPGWNPPSLDSYAVRVAGRHSPQRIVTFLDWISVKRTQLRERNAQLDHAPARTQP